MAHKIKVSVCVIVYTYLRYFLTFCYGTTYYTCVLQVLLKIYAKLFIIPLVLSIYYFFFCSILISHRFIFLHASLPGLYFNLYWFTLRISIILHLHNVQYFLQFELFHQLHVLLFCFFDS